jgi:dephospho-CoA kinase
MILGLTGTIGAGKGEAADYLADVKGFAHYSVRDFLMAEIAKRGLPPDRNSTRAVANELRQAHSPSYIVEVLYAKANERGGDALIESIRTIGEAKFLKASGAFIMAVDADRRLRYERIHARGASTDHVDFDTWVAQEDRELVSTDPWDMNVRGVMAMADSTILNEGSLDDLHAKIDAALAALTK